MQKNTIYVCRCVYRFFWLNSEELIRIVVVVCCIRLIELWCVWVCKIWFDNNRNQLIVKSSYVFVWCTHKVNVGLKMHEWKTKRSHHTLCISNKCVWLPAFYYCLATTHTKKNKPMWTSVVVVSLSFVTFFHCVLMFRRDVVYIADSFCLYHSRCTNQLWN